MAAEQSALQIAQEFCRRQGLPVPSTLTGAVDDATRQILGLMNEGIQALCDQYEWEQLLARYSFQHQGDGYAALDFNTALPDFKAMLPRTLWDTTSRNLVEGPLDETEWDYVTTMGFAPSKYVYHLKGHRLRIYPAPNPLTSVNFRFTYLSRYGVTDPAASANKESYVTDESYPRLPSYIILADLKWRWRQAKGLPYAEDFRTCEGMVVNAVGREPQAKLILDGGQETVGRPGIILPWPAVLG